MTNDPLEIERHTLQFYNQNIKEFYEHTVGLDLSAWHAPFLALLPPGGRILDAGCGSGRDSRRFLQMGYRVTAFDASPTMVEHATQLTGLPVRNLRFQDVNYEEEFDGVWACASLLHIPKNEILNAVSPLVRALKPGGIFYASFRFGAQETYQDERIFNNYTEDTFRELVGHLPELSILSIQLTQDTRPERAEMLWLHGIVRKVMVVDSL
ncbi:MAG TPA: class I SAM-dependent methyltransferase [Anaerolineaceae bacterium]|nr:class I SAM-dependent methyltransferase [Anaerolineaceae bacterium]